MDANRFEYSTDVYNPNNSNLITVAWRHGNENWLLISAYSGDWKNVPGVWVTGWALQPGSYVIALNKEVSGGVRVNTVWYNNS